MARIRRSAPEKAAESEINAVLQKIRKDFGQEVIGQASGLDQPDRIPTGVFVADMALLGGIPHNRIIHVIGERSAGKSTFADKCIAGAQAKWPDQQVIKIDIEGTHDSVWSEKLGVDVDRLLVSQPETGESALDIADALIGTKEASLIVIDSIAALVPMKEIENSVEDQLVGEQARMVGRMIRKVTAGMIKERHRGHAVTILLVNQYRMKVGVMWGDPRTAPGGKALEFAATIGAAIKNKEKMGRDEYDVEVVAENEHVIDITKNKMNGGIRSGEFRLRRLPDPVTGLNVGDIDEADTMLAFARKFGLYTGAGSSWKLNVWGEEYSCRGIADAVARLYGEPDLRWALRNQLIHEQASHLGMPESFLERYRP